jgi:hypothetical protein
MHPAVAAGGVASAAPTAASASATPLWNLASASFRTSRAGPKEPRPRSSTASRLRAATDDDDDDDADDADDAEGEEEGEEGDGMKVEDDEVIALLFAIYSWAKKLFAEKETTTIDGEHEKDAINSGMKPFEVSHVKEVTITYGLVRLCVPVFNQSFMLQLLVLL